MFHVSFDCRDLTTFCRNDLAPSVSGSMLARMLPLLGAVLSLQTYSAIGADDWASGSISCTSNAATNPAAGDRLPGWRASD